MRCKFSNDTDRKQVMENKPTVRLRQFSRLWRTKCCSSSLTTGGIGIWVEVNIKHCLLSYFFIAFQTSYSRLCDSYRIPLVCDNNHRQRYHKLDSAICNRKIDVACPCRSLVLGLPEGQNREMLILLPGSIGLMLMP